MDQRISRDGRRLAGAAAAALLLLFVLSPADASATCAPPTATSIVVDGDAADWTLVLANPANTARDGEGSSLDCGVSVDRDCPVSHGENDIARVSWTWDDTSLFFLLERYDPAGNQRYWIYLDVDGDGLMEVDEPLIRGRISKVNDNELAVYGYAPAASGGDPLVDPTALADGHDVAGGQTGSLSVLAQDIGLSADKLSYEAAVPWTVLGVSPGAPIGFHVALARSDDIPGDVSDNAGGRDGRLGTTAFSCVELAPDAEVAVSAGVPVRVAHAVTNRGNVPARFVVHASSSCGLDLRFEDDAGTLLGIDTGGDGSFAGPFDQLPPEGDPDGDGRLDTGVLAPGASFPLVVEHVPSTSPGCNPGRVDLHVEKHDDPAVFDDAVETVSVGELLLRPDLSRQAAAGATVWLPHLLVNATGQDHLVDLLAASVRGWTTTWFLDADGDGLPGGPGDLPAGDGDGDGQPDVTVAAGSAVDLLLAVDVPPAAANTLSDTLLLRATADGLPSATARDEVTVVAAVTLEPHHLEAFGDARHGGAGEPVYFPHRLVNGLGTPETFELTAVSDLGWPVTLLADPDGDGRPYDAVPLEPTTPPLASAGGVLDLLARVDIPAGALVDARTRVTVTAAASADPLLSDTALDDALVAIVRVYEDPARTFNVDATLPCTTLHAAATNLTPGSPEYRFAWRDGTGAVVQVTPTATDATGRAEDALTLTAGQVGPGWSLDIQQLQASVWVTIDTATYDVEDPVDLSGLAPAEPSYPREGSALLASADLVNTSFLLQPSDLSLRWVVLSPDGSSYLGADGAFTPYSGLEATRTEQVALLERLEARPLALAVADASYLAAGTHAIQIWLSQPCVPERLLGSASFEVDDDPDGDGLPWDDELAAGTDPQDADSDDDGLLDGLDGTGDSDGDGVIDALDCDSDDDGLTDGLEAGVDVAPADTDLAVGCFTPDQDPGTTTDPDAPDSDSGGVSDGAEDRNGDGRVDVGEGDPNDPADDVPACPADPPPEVADLRLAAEAAAVRLRWNPVPDDCVSYAVLAGDAPFGLGEAATGIGTTEHLDATPLVPSGLRYYLVRADGAVSGPGGIGR